MIIKFLLVTTLVLSQASYADTRPDDSDALQGVKTGKVVFDINMANPKKLTLYLMVIKETVDDLIRQNVKPDVVLAFRGKSVNLLDKERENVKLTEFDHLDKIAKQLLELQQKGVRMEACSVATRIFKVNNKSLLDGIKPVGNTFVSLTGYHAQGYASIPIY